MTVSTFKQRRVRIAEVPDQENSGLLLVRVRIVNQHGYVCPPHFELVSSASGPGRGSLKERITSHARSRMPSLSAVRVLDITRIPKMVSQTGQTFRWCCRLNLADAAQWSDSHTVVMAMIDETEGAA